MADFVQGVKNSMPEPIKINETFHPVSDGDHAFVNENGQIQIKTVIGSKGCTMLDYFAAKVMNSLIQQIPVNPSCHGINFNVNQKDSDVKKAIAEFSYDMAEFMMDERRKRQAEKDAK